jgi:hypothetical protein
MDAMANKQRNPRLVALGESLKDHLKSAGIGTMQAGVALGVGQISVQRHLRGDNEPSLHQLDVYARLCGVDTTDLLPRLDSNQQPFGPGIAAA